MEGFRLFPLEWEAFTKQPIPVRTVAGEGGNEGAVLSKTGFLKAQHPDRHGVILTIQTRNLVKLCAVLCGWVTSELCLG